MARKRQAPRGITTLRIAREEENPGGEGTEAVPIHSPARPSKRRKAPPTVGPDNRRTTRGMVAVQAKLASRNAVLGTNELLEKIMSFLPEKDLFLYKRVSKQFKSTIDSSPDLQKVMHLRPTDTPRERWFVEMPNYQTKPQMSMYPSARSQFLPGVIRTPVVLSPHLPSAEFSFHPKPGCTLTRPYPWCPLNLNDHIMRYYRNLYFRKNYSNVRCSLEDTYLSDPACQKARVAVFAAYKVGDDWVRFSMDSRTVEIESGLRVKDMLTAVFSDGNVFHVERDNSDDDPRVPETTGDRSDSFDDASLEEVLRELNTNKSHQKGIVDGRMQVWITLEGFVVPTAEQWALLRHQNKIAKMREEDDPDA